MSAENFDTRRALQLLAAIQQARRDLAQAEADHKRNCAVAQSSEQRIEPARERVNELYRQFQALTDPEPAQPAADAEPVADVETDAKTHRRRNRTAEEMPANQ